MRVDSRTVYGTESDAMSQTIHDYVVEALKSADLDAVNKATEIPPSTLKKIKLREIKNPGIRGIEILFRYFKKREGRSLRKRVVA